MLSYLCSGVPDVMMCQICYGVSDATMFFCYITCLWYDVSYVSCVSYAMMFAASLHESKLLLFSGLEYNNTDLAVNYVSHARGVGVK